MDSTLTSISQACDRLKTSRATLYKTLRKHGIKPVKQKGNHSYITPAEFETVKASLTNPQLNPPNPPPEQGDAAFYKAQLEKLEAKNELLSSENGNLKLELGKWQGRAEAYQQQLLRLEGESANRQVIYELKTMASEPENTPKDPEPAITDTGNPLIKLFKNLFK
jgi:hypothetical protein